MSERNTFIKEFSYMFLGTCLNLIIGVFTTPVITRLVDPEIYGQYSLFNTYVSIAMSFFTLGLDQALMRYFLSKEDVSYRKKLFEVCFLVPVLIFSGLSVIVILSSPFISQYSESLNTWVITMFCIATLVQIINRFGLVLVRVSFRTRMYAVLNSLQRLSYLLIAVPFLLISSNSGFTVLILAGIFSHVICVLVAMVVERKFLFGKTDRTALGVSIGELIKYGFPLMVAAAVIHLFQAADRICIQYFGTYADVGVYASAQNLMSVFNVITTTFNTIWAPRAIQHYERNPQDTSFYVKMNRIITIVMFAFGATVLIFKDVFVLLLGEEYREAASILPFLIFNPIMYTISETTVQGITFKKKTHSQLIISIVATVFNYALNMVLIPWLGFVGAAVSTGISYILFFTLRTLVAGRYFKFDFGLRKFYLLTFVFFAYSIYQCTHGFDLIGLLFYFVILALIFMLYRSGVKDIFNILIDFLKNTRNKLQNRK